MELPLIVLQKLVIISFGLFIVAADIIIVQNGINWIEAGNECFRKGGVISNEDEYGTCNSWNKGTKIWIETHHILSAWLGKIGCFDLGNASTSTQRTGSVQECYSQCDKPYFGYINTFCFCIRRIAIQPIENSRCLTDYSSQNTIAWVYVANELNISNIDDLRSGNCVGTRCTNMSSDLEVSNCNLRKQSLCQTGTHSRSPDTYSWETAENFCNINNADFSVTNLNDICKHIDFAEHDLDLYWTGYKRYWYKSTSNMSTESIQSLSEVFNCSYMECPNNAATAIHKQSNCSQKLNGYACLINRVPETTSKEESSISNNFTIKNKNQTTRDPNTDITKKQQQGHTTFRQIVSSRESETTVMNNSTSGTLEKLVKKPSYIVLILVLTVVAVTIISIGAVLVICRVRRQGPFKRKEKETASQMTEMNNKNSHDFETAPHNTSSISHTNTAHNTLNGARYALSDHTSENMQSDTASNNEYSVVVKGKKSSPGANDNNFDENEENTTDNEYDRLNQIRISAGGNYISKNIYDSSSGERDEYDPTYNTTFQNGKKDDNSVYDHT